MPFTPRQLEGLDGYTVSWNPYQCIYTLRVRRIVTHKFLGFLWPVSVVKVDAYEYIGQALNKKEYVRPDELDKDTSFLDNLIANMWQK